MIESSEDITVESPRATDEEEADTVGSTKRQKSCQPKRVYCLSYTWKFLNDWPLALVPFDAIVKTFPFFETV